MTQRGDESASNISTECSPESSTLLPRTPAAAFNELVEDLVELTSGTSCTQICTFWEDSLHTVRVSLRFRRPHGRVRDHTLLALAEPLGVFVISFRKSCHSGWKHWWYSPTKSNLLLISERDKLWHFVHNEKTLQNLHKQTNKQITPTLHTLLQRERMARGGGWIHPEFHDFLYYIIDIQHDISTVTARFLLFSTRFVCWQ